jgi:hypothetical protein
MTSVRAYHKGTLISQDSSVLITGGVNGPSALSSVEKYIPSTGCFQSMRSMLRARYLHTADQLPSLSGYVLIAGGCVSGVGMDFVDLYHPITTDILPISLSTERCYHASAILSSSQLVLIGGLGATGAELNSSDMIDTSSNSSFYPATNTMAPARTGHTATVLGNMSNIVFIAGGVVGGVYTSSVLLYHGLSNTFIALSSGVTLPSSRSYHTATCLPPPIHKVIITGGYNGGVFGTIVLFDVASLTITAVTNSSISQRYFHTATLLPNGKILIAGAYNTGSLSSCQLIDPSNGYSVTSASNLNTNRYLHSATLLADGTVLVCGGFLLYPTTLNTCEIYFV